MSHGYRAIALLLATGLFLAASVTSADEAKSLKFSKRCLMVSPNEGCAIVDVNNDGKLDIVAGTHWFANPEFLPRPLRDIEEMGDIYYQTNGDLPYDVDGDGRTDIISIGWMDPALRWFKNPTDWDLERGKRWPVGVLKETRGQNEAATLHDFDGDGVPEFFVNHWDGKAEVVAWKFTKTADGKPTVEKKLLGNEGHGHGYAIGDINGDGREDIVVEAGWYECPEGDPFAKLWTLHKELKLPHASCPCIVTDLNGDGRNDIIWGKAHGFGLYWWEQGEPKADGETTWKEHLIDGSWSQAHCLVWTDLDGDKQPDLITGKRVRGHCGNDPGGKEPAVVYYYTWDKDAGKFTRHTIGAPGEGIGTGMQISTGDINGDGRLDIAVSGKTGTWLILNEGFAE